MPACPRCQATVEANALQCPQCRLVLKAHGHPGIPLHRAEGEAYLCDRCTYHLDDTCTYPQRPLAKTCTLFQDADAAPEETLPALPVGRQIELWFKRNTALVGLLVLAGVSLLFAIARSQ